MIFYRSEIERILNDYCDQNGNNVIFNNSEKIIDILLSCNIQIEDSSAANHISEDGNDVIVESDDANETNTDQTDIDNQGRENSNGVMDQMWAFIKKLKMW